MMAVDAHNSMAAQSTIDTDMLLLRRQSSLRADLVRARSLGQQLPRFDV